MRKFGRSIRFRITQITVLFTLTLTVVLGSASFFFFQNYARKSVIQAAEFNLQLVMGMVRQDLINLNAMSNWCTVDSSVIRFLTDEPLLPRKSLDAYDKVREQYTVNRSASYLHRLLVTDGHDRILQIGSPLINPVPLTAYNIHEFVDTPTGSGMWQSIAHDPYTGPNAPDCIYTMRPILEPATGLQIGVVVMLVSTEVVTNQLRSYQLTAADRLYFTMDGQSWRIDGTSFTKQPEHYIVKREISQMTREGTTTVTEMMNSETGALYTAISCPVGIDGMTLSHYLPESTFSSQRNLLLLMLLGGCALIQVLGMGISRYLNHLIMDPVGKMRNRMSIIAGGDFSPDATIEWDNELGDVGRGINQISRNMAAMLESRLADEGEKQALKYKMLQNQINPHFIYNTLNSIKWMATIQNATGIAEMTTAFSRLLKSVSKSDEELIPLSEEFALLNDYCTIQQYRYGGSITLEIAEISDENLCRCLIPRFTLQPLAENAIFHGIEPKGGVGSILLFISQNEKGEIFIVLQDDGVGMSPETIERIFSVADTEDKQKFKQVGIRNVHRRLQYAFGEEYGITITSCLGEYTRINILMPCLRPDDTAQSEILKVL